MADLDGMVGTVQHWLEPIITDDHLRPREEGHDGGLAYSGVSDDDDGLVAVGVFGDARDTVFDHLAELEEV